MSVVWGRETGKKKDNRPEYFQTGGGRPDQKINSRALKRVRKKLLGGGKEHQEGSIFVRQSGLYRIKTTTTGSVKYRKHKGLRVPPIT